MKIRRCEFLAPEKKVADIQKKILERKNAEKKD